MHHIQRILLVSFLVLLTLPTTVQAQIYVNNQNINLMEGVAYIELIMDRRLFQANAAFAVIDYGQVIRAGNFRANRVTDKNGKPRSFRGEMDIFNFLYRNGWIHETTYARESSVYHIFRRKGLDK